MLVTLAPNQISNLITQGIDQGLHAGARVCLWRAGETICDLALGHAAHDASGASIPIRLDTIILWLSAGKPLGAVALLILQERGLLELDDPVAQHIPEFAQHGKQAVTLRHLLTHTGGFRFAVGLDEPGTREQILEKIYAAELEPNWIPGQRAGYHIASSWHILDEVVRRVGAMPYPEFIRENIFEPLGMRDCHAGGMPHEHYETYVTENRLAGMTSTKKGNPPFVPFVPLCEKCMEDRPGSNTRGPAHELIKFILMLGRNGFGLNGTRILSSPSVAEMRRQQHDLNDETFGFPLRWGLGLILNSTNPGFPGGRHMQPYGYGQRAGPETFGHGGAQCASIFYDPQRDLAGAFAFNGQPGEPAHQRRMLALFEAIDQSLQ